MITYKYSFFAKLLYRYGNIPLTLLLLVYLAASIIGMLTHWYFIFFAIINLAILIWLNKYYLKTYRSFPFIISAESDRIVCSGFFLDDRTVEIKFCDIDKIRGGIFSGYTTRPVYIHDSVQDITIGFYSGSGKFNELLMTLIKNVNEELYQELIYKMKKVRDGG